MKVWVVTTGEYSDYNIRGILSTREKAELLAGLYCDCVEITEWEVDRVPESPPRLLPYCVHMTKAGDVPLIERSDLYHVEEYSDAEVVLYNSLPLSTARLYHGEKTATFYMWARDEQHAIKIANERRTTALALGKVMTDEEANSKIKSPRSQS